MVSLQICFKVDNKVCTGLSVPQRTGGLGRCEHKKPVQKKKIRVIKVKIIVIKITLGFK